MAVARPLGCRSVMGPVVIRHGGRCGGDRGPEKNAVEQWEHADHATSSKKDITDSHSTTEPDQRLPFSLGSRNEACAAVA